jgi:DNA repair protein RecN (Recombination protein N)
LSKSRQRSAGELEKTVAAELKDLALEKARFVVRLEATGEPTPKGMETCAFFLSANPGEEPKPLNKVASGGELSRIMLAIRRAIPAGKTMSTAVFDEVDAGIGGVAATKVGEKLQKVAQGLQVLCVTHLPQVAAFADCHYRVEKHQGVEHTRTDLVALAGEERVREMARMLGGAQVTDRTLEHARELIGQSVTASG